MNGEIRKISVGKDYPDGVLHYQVGKTINLIRVPYQITDILFEEDVYNIYIANDNGKVLWKTISNVPVVVEYNINFD